jgi:hypothetical protein
MLGFLISWDLWKWVLYLIVALVSVFLYFMAYKPWKTRQYYKKYPNVYMRKEYSVLMGNLPETTSLRENDFQDFHISALGIKEDPKQDMMLLQLGPTNLMLVTSVEGVQEMATMVPG